MDNTDNGNILKPNELVPKAPTYNELISTVVELTKRLQKLESTTDSPPVQPQTSKLDDNSETTSTVDYRILPDVGTSIWSFKRHESSGRVEDWISSVDGLAQVNQWPLRY